MTHKLDEYIKELGSCDMSYRFGSAIKTGYILALYRSQLSQWHEKFPDKLLQVDSDGITLQTDDREQTMFFILTFGGSFKKSLEDYQKDKIRYDQLITPDPLGREASEYWKPEFRLSIRSATPPPSCEIVEYEEDVPATTIKKRKIVCPVEENLVEKTLVQQEVEAEEKETQNANI